MIKITNIKIPAAEAEKTDLTAKAAAILGVRPQELTGCTILRRSVDSRKKPDVFFLYTVAVSTANQAALLRRHRKNANISEYTPEKYTFPWKNIESDIRPVVVGMGPAGLFAALSLAEAGLSPIVLERGQDVDTRTADIERYWNGGPLTPASNVQFGEGGAGTFSDGKLTTGTKDVRIGHVFRRFVEFGADPDILYSAKPHIGTDVLRNVVKAMRLRLIALGCDVRFGHKLERLHIENDALTAIDVSADSGDYTLPCRALLLAPGNSARDTFRTLADQGVTLQAKSFAVGVRIEHLQKDVDLAQYGTAATLGTLPASDYKLAVHLDSGRSVFTFCVCPGGHVVAASSEPDAVVTNGMSYRARDGKNINGGLLVAVSPEDFPPELFGGMEFQQKLERAAYKVGNDALAPAQLVSDFLRHKASSGPGRVSPTYRPGVHWCNLWDVLPDFICQALADALPEMEKKIRGFSAGDAVLTAVETRSSSPVRICRNEAYMANIHGLFPCGEGAGYAGGITSASVDGVRCAEAVCRAIVEKAL